MKQYRQRKAFEQKLAEKAGRRLVSFDIPIELYDQLVALARAKNMYLEDLIEHILVEYLASEK